MIASWAELRAIFERTFADLFTPPPPPPPPPGGPDVDTVALTQDGFLAPGAVSAVGMSGAVGGGIPGAVGMSVGPGVMPTGAASVPGVGFVASGSRDLPLGAPIANLANSVLPEGALGVSVGARMLLAANFVPMAGRLDPATGTMP